ncbi:MAG: serine/threonine protein phosphatase [Firmicutes bacterium]|nr:serine/threonine protein phosphatase [Bacillota bacterium]
MIYAISDLHLSLGGEKPMDIFGELWKDHHLKLRENWLKIVEDDDTVIIGGDFSWALKLEEAREDLDFVHRLPGNKILFKGNHDYWWQSYNKVKKALPPSIQAVQNNYIPYQGRLALCGTRGWTIPGGENYTAQDEKIYQRELIRLRLSLSKAQEEGFDDFIVTLHYPPFNFRGENSGFTAIMQEFAVRICLYGHLHNVDQQDVFQGERDGIDYFFVAADFLDFNPRLILDS